MRISGRTNATYGVADILGLCQHLEYHRLYRWMTIYILILLNYTITYNAYLISN